MPCPIAIPSTTRLGYCIYLLMLTLWTGCPPTDASPGASTGILDLYEKALANDAQYKAGESRYKADSLAPQIARSNLLPQINLTASRQRFAEHEIEGAFFRAGDAGDSENYSYDTDDFSIRLTQTLFNPQQYAALRQSRSQAKKAQLELEATRQQLILRVAEAYFNVLSAAEELEFARAEKQAVSRQTEQARERFDVGLVAIADVKEAEAAYDLAEAEEIMADNHLKNAMHALSVITNHDITTLRPLAEEIPVLAPEPDNMQSWVDKSLSQNIELLGQQISANIAEQEISLQRAAHYPKVDLFASHNESNLRSGAPAPRQTETFVVGVELNLPIFAGQGTTYRTKQAVELHREAMHRLAGTQREIKRATRETYLSIITSISRVAALERATESAQISLEANEAGFQVGTRTSVDVVLALKELFRARRDYAKVRYEYLLNTVRLKKVAGMLAEQDIQRLDGYLRPSL